MPERTLAPAPARGSGARGARAAGASILVDVRGLHASGIGRYIREVLAALLADPRFGRVKLLGDVDAVRDFCSPLDGGEKVAAHPYPYGFYSPRAQLAWPGLRLRGVAEADVAFFPHYDAPFFALPPRSVVTVQDLIHFKVPEAFSPWRRAAAGLLLRKVVTRATRVLVSSESTRRDLAERIPESEHRVEVIPFGVNPFFTAGTDAPLPAAGIGHPYLLCVGNRKPHKNLVAAVEALAQLRHERPDLRLVMVGQVYPGWEEVLGRAERLGVRDRIVDLHGVTDARLRELYAGCEALLFLSLYEGFGLPVLEAMGCGAPVIASDRASIPEVVGDAGLLVDPHDHAGVADAVRRLRAEPALREERVRRGRERAARFTWERAARETVDALHRVARARRP